MNSKCNCQGLALLSCPHQSHRRFRFHLPSDVYFWISVISKLQRVADEEREYEKREQDIKETNTPRASPVGTPSTPSSWVMSIGSITPDSYVLLTPSN